LDYYHLHPLANHPTIQAFVADPPFLIPDDKLSYYKAMLSTVEDQKGLLSALPKQFVHHDVLIFNLLSEEEAITGVLDFDFISWDVALFEFAISLNHVLQMSGGSLEMAKAFIEGYSEYRQCSPVQIQQLQLFTRIYHIALLHIYIGQHYAGKKVEDPFNYILDQFKLRDEWLNIHLKELNPR
jgi:homoserine kinase type II